MVHHRPHLSQRTWLSAPRCVSLYSLDRDLFGQKCVYVFFLNKHKHMLVNSSNSAARNVLLNSVKQAKVWREGKKEEKLLKDHKKASSKFLPIYFHIFKLFPKISDFGMSRETNQDNYYVSKGCALPVRWTAPEV